MPWHISMIFIGHKLCLDNAIDIAENNDQDRVEDTCALLDIPRCLLTNFFVGRSDFTIYYDNDNLKSEEKAHKEKADWYTIA